MPLNIIEKVQRSRGKNISLYQQSVGNEELFQCGRLMPYWKGGKLLQHLKEQKH